MLRRVQAATRLRACAEALGELRVRLLDCCVLRDLSWREIAALLRVSDKTATVWVVGAALSALSDWRRGCTVAPPLIHRYRISRADSDVYLRYVDARRTVAIPLARGQRWATGATGQEIAAELGLTPGAVSAKARRERLKSRYQPSGDRHHEPIEAVHR